MHSLVQQVDDSTVLAGDSALSVQTSEGPLVHDAGTSREPKIRHDLRSVVVATELSRDKPAGIYALAPYSPAAARLVVSWKEQGDRHSLQVIRLLMGNVLDAATSQWGPLDLVPVPALFSTSRARGGSPLHDIIDEAAIERNLEIRRPIIRQHRRDQVGLGRLTRIDNAQAGFVMRARAGANMRGVLVIDDVITTGATVVTCGQLLASAGWRVHALVAPFARQLSD